MTKFFFFMIFLLSTISSICSNVLHLSAGESVIISEGNSNIVSRGGIFEMGIFKSSRERYSKLDRWFLGIWFRRQPTTVVWVANKEEPLYNPTGNIMVSHFDIILLNHSGGIVWKSPLTEDWISNAKLVAELQDNGNFLLRYSNRRSNNNRRNPDGTLWQSFDYPTDTLLPGMQVNSLTSWATALDPSSGDFKFGMDASSREVLQGYVWETRRRQYRIDPTYASKFKITNYSEEIAFSLREGMNAALQVTRLGILRWLEWTTAGEWKFEEKSIIPNDECDTYNTCGSNGYCEMEPWRTCRCILGFQRTDKPPFRCVRQARLSCLEDMFWPQKSVKLPETTIETTVDTKLGLEECKAKCLEDCSCTAYAITTASLQNGGSGCVMWIGDLKDIRSYKTDKGQDLYVRVANLGQKKNKNQSRNKTIIGLTVGASGLLLIGFITLCFLKRRKKKARATAAAASRESNRNIPLELTEDWNSVHMDFDAIAEATENFSDTNQIGRGGFGIVYKGRLLDGQEVAVKRLTEMSRQGIEGFNKEVRFIAVVQHVNIVRLLGYFSNHINKILVYEFLENSSLDTYLFDTTRSSILKWDQRLDIINGIARGLLYLHQDSRFRIIHLDMKPSNILLGKDMVPKISDFGLAQILRGDETEATVTRVAGSFGYMAPEYVREKVYSAKSDVFSFGVLLLEIVSGKKNSEFSRLNDGDNLLSFIWSHWNEGKGLEIVDPVIKDSSSGFQLKQALRCLQIGLLCVQELAVDRPTMSSVVSMLGSDDTQQILKPKSPDEPGSLREGESSFTIPQITMSIFDPR